MSLEIGKAYEYDGWLFVPVSLEWLVFTVLTLDDGNDSNGYRGYGTTGQTTTVFACSDVDTTAREVK